MLANQIFRKALHWIWVFYVILIIDIKTYKGQMWSENLSQNMGKKISIILFCRRGISKKSARNQRTMSGMKLTSKVYWIIVLLSPMANPFSNSSFVHIQLTNKPNSSLVTSSRLLSDFVPQRNGPRKQPWRMVKRSRLGSYGWWTSFVVELNWQ